jgi:hypothetical protein
MPQIYRRDPDSATLKAPRVFARVFCRLEDLLSIVRFYETITGQVLDQDIDLSEQGMHIVAVGGFLILVLDQTKVPVERYTQARLTNATIINPDLDAAVARSLALGSELVGQRFVVPHGAGQRLRHPDGALVEYLEHRPSAYDVQTPGNLAA